MFEYTIFEAPSELIIPLFSICLAPEIPVDKYTLFPVPYKFTSVEPLSPPI